MVKKKLSICIPTYNRKEKVIHQIERIIQSGILKSGNEVELVVSDNCSDDNTYDSLFSLFHDQDGISLYHQNNNLGLVGNLYFLFDIAKGEYIWFLSDDDPIDPRSIGNLLSIIIDDPRSFYLLNFVTDDNSELFWRESNDYLSLFNDKTWGGFGLLSTQVLKKESFKDFYLFSKDRYNLCQPVAVSLYGLVYLNGIICYDIVAITHHIGDYSWKNKTLQVGSVYLYDSIKVLEIYGSDKKYQEIITALKKMHGFCTCSFIHIIRNKDFKYAQRLFKDNLLGYILLRAICYIIKSKFSRLIKKTYAQKVSIIL
jgi:glycosyltransferase involved in cell wall biosynthesis